MKQDQPHNTGTEIQANEAGVSRRSFMQIAGVGLAASAAAYAGGCSGKPIGGGGWMPEQYEGTGNFPVQLRGRVPIDPQNVSIMRNDSKCILCGQCAEVCNRAEAIMGHYELPLIDDIPCIGCGQCTLWCPTGAITERDDTLAFLKALDDPDLHVVVQTAPSTRVALGEEFGMIPGTNVEGKQVAALKALGCNQVFDTNFSADLTIVEEATELVKRIKGELNAPIPMFTSCCPGWIKFCEYFYPEFLPNLSTALSPMSMLSPLVKTYYAGKNNLDPSKIFSVAIMPCTAKKFEASRPEMNNAGANKLGDPSMRDTDLVLTTRELAKALKIRGINLPALEDAPYDKLMSEYSGAGAIFGATGGVMEAAVRTAYHYITGEKEIPALLYELEPIRGLTGIKSAKLDVPGVGEVRVGVVSGMANAKKVLEQIKSGAESWHFIEFMACPGGCISGGGQPKTSLPPSDYVRKDRTNAIYSIDERMTLRLSHENQEIKTLYENYIDQDPNEHLAHKLLHTSGYTDRSMNLTAKK
ncbi:MAG: [FeFe] hydrogenase, group A [Planctomycetaceae bacterium]|nr:[FeFe] hydrogenase, group A [Planctomycetaceae bacterium]